MTFRSEQEKAIHDLSTVVLGAQALFKPDNYKNGTKEAADLVWVSGRCAVLMYMTSGKQSFDKKRKHNLGQLHRWLRHWEAGHNLTGTIDGQPVSYGYGDIDHVLGLSVIGGTDIGCIYEDREVVFSKGKLAACVTITDAVFQKMSRRFVSIRDVVFLALVIREMGGRIGEADVIAFVDYWAGEVSAQMRKEFDVKGGDYSDLEAAWRDLRSFMLNIRASPGARTSSGMLADFSFSDVVWLSVAEAALCRKMAPPGETGAVWSVTQRKTGIYKLQCFVSARLKYGMSESIELSREPHFILRTSLDLGPDTPLRMVVMRDPGEERMLVRELLELRDLSIPQAESR